MRVADLIDKGQLLPKNVYRRGPICTGATMTAGSNHGRQPRQLLPAVPI